MGYHLIPYNFEKYDFYKLNEEAKKYEGEIYWKRTGHVFSEGDTCFFYCTNLPDMTRRILLKATVSIPKCSDPDIKNDKNLSCFKIADIRAIRLKEPENLGIAKYSYENITSPTYNIGSVQGKLSLKASDNGHGGIHQKLVDDLKSEQASDCLSDVKEYYEHITQCAFSDMFLANAHESFMKLNGFLYFETHHVIQRKLLSNEQVPDSAIEDPRNKFYVCPTCHRRIHYGKEKDVKDMIEHLYNKRKSFYDKCFEDHASMVASDSLKWLYKIYKVD